MLLVYVLAGMDRSPWETACQRFGTVELGPKPDLSGAGSKSFGGTMPAIDSANHTLKQGVNKWGCSGAAYDHQQGDTT